MSSLEAQGIIHTIGQTTEYGQNGFTKREFVIKLTGEHENDEYPNYVEFELIKDKCLIMDTYQTGMTVKVGFNLQGRLWQGEGKPEKCFNALQAWKIENIGQAAPAPMAPQAPAPTPQAPAPMAAPALTNEQLLTQYKSLNPTQQVDMWKNLNVDQQNYIHANINR